MSHDIDNDDMIETFVTGGGQLGAAHVSPWTNNAMEMEFTVGPPGIGNEPGVVFDISRQRESYAWRQDLGTWYPHNTGSSDNPGPFIGKWPVGEEAVNDDGPNNNQQDEDNTPTANHIYSRDMPGDTTDQAGYQRLVVRFNMREFVRVKVNGDQFTNVNGPAEGSRASGKEEWYSRMDVKRHPVTGLWDRNNTQPTGENENEIKLGKKPLSQNIPSGAAPIPDP